jgi:hypothetical protein
MKVKNYNKGNYTSAFDCVIYGEIEMTWKEWMKASSYLLRSGGDMLEKRMLREDITRIDKYLETPIWTAPTKQKNVTYRNIRVTYTQKLFKHFNLPRYKQQNYVIKIITN